MSGKQAGRELDAEVAEKVMGLEIVHRRWPCAVQPDCCEPEAARAVLDDTYSVVLPPTLRDTREGTEDEMDPYYYGEKYAVVTRRRSDGSVYDLDPTRPYSTDIAAAWEVVTHLCRNGYWFSLSWNGEEAEVGIDRCTADSWECIADHVRAPTVPLAICHAALAAAASLGYGVR